MNKRHKTIIEFVSKYIENHGYSPTLQEIAHGIGLKSTSNIENHIKKMVKEGSIIKEPKQWRGLKIPDQSTTS